MFYTNGPLNTNHSVRICCMNVNFNRRKSQQFHLYSILKPIPNVTQRQRHIYSVKRFVAVAVAAADTVVVLVVVSIFFFRIFSPLWWSFLSSFYFMIDQATIFCLNQPGFCVHLYKYLIFAAQIGYFNQTLCCIRNINITLRFCFWLGACRVENLCISIWTPVPTEHYSALAVVDEHQRWRRW